jgi:uncharacterized protein
MRTVPADALSVKRSRYLVVSPDRFRTAEGVPMRLAYSTRTAKTVPVDLSVAEALEQNTYSSLSEDELARLVAAEVLVPQDEDELGTVTSRLSGFDDTERMRLFTIMPTSYCNMACSYCGQEHRKGRIAAERARRMTDRVLAAIRNPGTSEVRVVWFGGEPLLALRVIREMSAEFVAAAREHRTRYSATVVTNGSLLTRRNLAVLHDDCRVSWAEITLDGPEEIHDRRRLRRNGAPSFRHITTLLSSMLAAGSFPRLGVGIRVNIDHENSDHIPDLLTDLAMQGLAHPRVGLKLARVHSWGNDVTQVELGARSYAEREASWLRTAVRLGFQVPLMPAAPVAMTCTATTRNAEVVDADGGVFSCTEHPLVPRDMEAGRLTTTEELAATARRPGGRFDGWYGEVAEGRWPCSTCPILPLCGGSCPKLWSEEMPPCPSAKFNWPARLALIAAGMGWTAEATGEVRTEARVEAPAGARGGESVDE